MIESTLSLIEKRLSEFFNSLDESHGNNRAILCNMINQDGSVVQDTKDKVVMALTNIQYETVISTYKRSSPAAKGEFNLISPPLYINLFIMFTANFEGDRNKYGEALKFISYTISFFQQNSFFNKQNLPGLDPRITQLAFEMTNLDDQELSYLIGMFGAKYLPSVYYKVRLLPYQEGDVKAKIPVLKGKKGQG